MDNNISLELDEKKPVADLKPNKMELMNIEIEKMSLADKMSPSLCKGAEEVDVEVNGFMLELTKMVPIVHKYSIEMMNKTDDRERSLTSSQRSDFVVIARRRVCQSLFQDYLEKCQLQKSKYMLPYDGGNIFYSTKRLPVFEENDGSFELNIEKGEVTSSNSLNYLGKKSVSVQIKIQHTLEVITNKISGKLNEDAAANDAEVCQFLEILTSANLHKTGDHFVFKNKSYEKSSRGDASIGQGKIVKRGMQKNCRVVDALGNASVMMQIGAKKSPFITGTGVVNYCASFLECRDPESMEKALREARNFRAMNTQLKDVWACTTHLKDKKNVCIYGLHKKNAKSTTFTHTDGEEMTVADYFKMQHKISLKYPHLPLLIEKRGGKISYHPMELLEIHKGQRVTTAKSTPQLTDKMIRECQLKPADMKELILAETKEANLDYKNDNRYLDAFGVRVSSHAVQASGRRLHAPSIRYANESVEPRGAILQWGKLNGREQFVKPATMKKSLVFINFDRCVHSDEVRKFVSALCNVGRSHGMLMEEKKLEYIDMSSEVDTEVDRMFSKHASNTSIFMFVTNNKMDPIHDVMKVCEARYGVVTQHIWKQTFIKAIGQQGAFMVLGNLIMKTNLKLGGVNHSLAISKDFMRENPTAKAFNESLFPRNRMMIGLDVSHAGPQSFAERQLKVEQSEPTVVGMAYTLSMSTEVRGTYWMQAPRLATISDLADNTKQALEQYHEHNKCLPDDIVIFRGGVSEGEFKKVVKEMEDMAECFPHVAHLHKSGRYSPCVTCIVVATNSNYRIFPTRIDARARPMDQNVQPGTIIDTGIIHPSYNEFLLVPQKALQGTAKPIRCTVVHRKEGMTGKLLSMDEIEQLTNALCYGHQVVCGSTGVPSLCYAATNLTKRGRNNWKTINFSDSDMISTRSGASGDAGNGKYKNDGSVTFFQQMSKDLKSRVNAHYWA